MNLKTYQHLHQHHLGSGAAMVDMRQKGVARGHHRTSNECFSVSFVLHKSKNYKEAKCIAFTCATISLVGQVSCKNKSMSLTGKGIKSTKHVP